MALRFIQLYDEGGSRVLAAALDDGPAHRVNRVDSLYSFAAEAIAQSEPLRACLDRLGTGSIVDLISAANEKRLLPAIDHEDHGRLHLTGTGLTHLGSAQSRDSMHKMAASEATTDSMRMFLMGVEGGKPEGGRIGVQPEWFFKGDGSCVVGPGEDLRSPDFALDGSEEPELAGVYMIGPDGNPRRLGFVLANEFSDHVTEQRNYLWLAHSKLRPAALGAELITGALPSHVQGTSRIVRDGEVLWQKPFVSGEANMSHSIANLEHHHFKYELFRRPGDIHVHFFGTATLSFADSIRTRENDNFEIEAEPFRLPLRNRLRKAESPAVQVTEL